MDNLEKFALAMTKEPKKSFRKAGILDGENLLTTTGSRIFLFWLLEKYENEFKEEIVDKLLEE